MDAHGFSQLIARLERESAAAPTWYRAKVVALTLLGFGILAATLGVVGAAALAIVGLAVTLAFGGGSGLLLLAKFGKLLLVLLIPLWFLLRGALRALFVRLPAPQGREITAAEAPALFAALDDMRQRLRGPRFDHVLIVGDVNAAVVQRPAFGLFGWPRNYLLLGLPLLEAMPAEEALSVVAHEYGHLAGSHGRFSAFIYRLRHTWGTVQAHVDQLPGWGGRLFAAAVGRYAPYFNAYTFVLARSDEYRADAAAAELVGPAPAAAALKRVNLVAPRHRQFMERTIERIDHDPAPPPDLMHRWAETVAVAAPTEDIRRWLSDAWDREGHVADTHPTLRARIEALPGGAGDLDPPPELTGPSAAQTWLGERLEAIRAEFGTDWYQGMAMPWAQRHAEVKALRERLHQLQALPQRDAEQEIERLRLTRRLEPDTDLREALASFNALHWDHPVGLFLHGSVLLDHDDAAGLALLDRAMALDPEATKPACERAHAFLAPRQPQEAERYAARWREREALERLRAHQLEHVGGKDPLVPHDLPARVVDALRARLRDSRGKYVGRVYLARRPIPADPSAVQFLLAVRLTWWGRRLDRHQQVVEHLARLEWPVPLTVLTLEGRYARLRKTFQALPGARLA